MQITVKCVGSDSYTSVSYPDVVPGCQCTLSQGGVHLPGAFSITISLSKKSVVGSPEYQQYYFQCTGLSINRDNNSCPFFNKFLKNESSI